MNVVSTTIRLLLIASLSFQFCCPNLSAQQDEADDFGDFAQDPAEADFAADLGVDVAADADDTELTDDAPVVTRAFTSPAVRSLLDSDPQEPDELVRAVDLLNRFGRADLALDFLKRLQEADLSDIDLTQLQRQYGSAMFVRLARERELQPASREFALKVLAAARRTSEDPALLAQRIEHLASENETRVKRAILELLAAGDTAVGPLLTAMANETADQTLRNRYRSILVKLGQRSIQPLAAATVSGNEKIRFAALEALGRTEAREALLYFAFPYLDPAAAAQLPFRNEAESAFRRTIGGVPTADETILMLERKAGRSFNGQSNFTPDQNGRVQLWTWDPTNQTAIPQRLHHRDASKVIAARFSRDLSRLEPNRLEYKRWYLTSRLHLDKALGGLDAPLRKDEGSAYAVAKQHGAAALDDILTFAIEQDEVAAALGAIEILAEIGDASLLANSSGRPRALICALQHGDLRLAHAAAGAIMKFNPKRNYPGASYMAEGIGRLISTTGTRQVLIGHPRLELAQAMAGMVGEMGFEADVVPTGSQFLRRSIKSVDYEFFLVSDALERPYATECIQQLRGDPRTSHMPVGLIARADHLTRSEILADEDDFVITALAPNSSSQMSLLIQKLLSLRGRYVVSTDRRIAMASDALDWMLDLTKHDVQRWPKDADSMRPFYDLHRHEPAVINALNAPELSAKAARVLGMTGSPKAQAALADLASQVGYPLVERRAAVSAFDIAIARRGVMLTRQQIREQYQRYNDSRDLDADSQRLLGAVLDSIEAPTSSTIKSNIDHRTSISPSNPGGRAQ